MGKFDPALYDELAEKLTKLVARARDSKRAAQLAFARKKVPGFSKNRRSPDGPTDPDLSVLFVQEGSGRPMAVLANYTAHGTVLSDKNYLVSGDWPGAFQRALEEELSTIVLFTNGAQGDIAPRAPGGRDDFERSDALGRALAQEAANLVRGIANTREDVTLTYVERGVDLPSPTLPVVVPKKTVLGVLRIDDIRLFCFPGEPIVELGLALKKRFPGAWILGLANDHPGYFLTEAEYRKGGYERRMSFYGPKAGPRLAELLEELGEGEHAKDRARQPERRSR